MKLYPTKNLKATWCRNSYKNVFQEYARYLCQQHGPTWDLAFINFRHEFYYLVDLIGGNCLDDESFWFGYNKDGKDFETVFGKSSSWKLASHLKK